MSTKQSESHDERTRLAEQFQRAQIDGPWHGPSLAQVLEGIDAELALRRPIPSAHNIWEIVLHISGWEDVVRRRIEGEAADEPDEGDWPEVRETSEEAWRATLATLAARNERLRDAVASSEKLDSANLVPGGRSTAWETLLGELQHEAYHAGQIAVLKKQA
jgi:uncharacterized damage-inducible protein DinB